MDFGDVMILVLGIASCVISIAVKKEKDAGKKIGKTGAGRYRTPVEVSVDRSRDIPLAPKKVVEPVFEEGGSSLKVKKETVKQSPRLPEPEIEEQTRREPIDKKKLVIYSELMKPKF